MNPDPLAPPCGWNAATTTQPLCSCRTAVRQGPQPDLCLGASLLTSQTLAASPPPTSTPCPPERVQLAHLQEPIPLYLSNRPFLLRLFSACPTRASHFPLLLELSHPPAPPKGRLRALRSKDSGKQTLVESCFSDAATGRLEPTRLLTAASGKASSEQLQISQARKAPFHSPARAGTSAQMAQTKPHSLLWLVSHISWVGSLALL